MQPQNNVQNGAPVSAQPVKTAPVAPQPATAAPVKETPKKDNLFENAPKKRGKGMVIGLVICILLATAGIAFGVWTMMDSRKQKDALNEQISTLKTQNSELMNKLNITNATNSSVTDTGNDYNNPIIKADNEEEIYSIGFESSYILGQDATRKIGIRIADGKIDSCTIFERQVDNSWQTVGQCGVNGLDGNIYKVIQLGEGQDGSGSMIGFITEDGKIAYCRLYDLENADSVDIIGYLDLNKPIIDALEISVGAMGAGGYDSTIFVLSDGSYIKFDKSMFE